MSAQRELEHLNGESDDFATSNKTQYLAALCMSLLSFSYGAGCGWTSAAIVQLTDEDFSPLEYGAIDTEDVGWIASAIGIGGFLGNLLFGWLSEKMGRKNTLYIVVMPSILSWILIAYAQQPLIIIISRIFMGLMGGGVFAVVPNYISEISDDHVRGRLGSFLVLTCNTGLLYAYICGDYFAYRTVPWLLVPPSFAFIILFTRIHDSPSFLLKKGLIHKAEKSVAYFKSIETNVKGAKEYVDESLRKLQHHDEKAEDEEEEISTKLSLKHFQTKSARKAIIYGICLVALNQFCGCFAMLNFTATIFKDAGSSLSPNASSIFVGVIQLIGSAIATMLVEKCGRKFMMTISALGTSMGLATFGFYSLMQSKGYDMENLKFVPLLSFSLIIFIANLGILTLPFLILSEISHPKIRGFTSTLCMSFCWSFVFVAIKYLPVLTETIGMHGATFVFAINSLVGAIFILICLPETKGRSFDEIRRLLE